MPQIVIVMGSDADLPVLEPAFAVLRSFPVSWEARVISAHRTPETALEFARGARAGGVQVIIAAAGKAAHLAGALAASTTLPSSAFRSVRLVWEAWTLCLLPCRCRAACQWRRSL